ncbi:helicase associated domain-containing protein, partial [Pelagophyceae sp. CCMP2097]
PDWVKHYRQLAAYHETHGTSLVPYKFVTKDGFKLGKWVESQRQAYHEDELAPEFREQLEIVQFKWDVPIESSEKWEEHFSLLQAYKAEQGDCLVPKNFKQDGTRIGLWVYDQRQLYKTGKGLSQDRVERLDGLGLVWVPK